MEITKKEAKAIVYMALAIISEWNSVSGEANAILVRIAEEWPDLVASYKHDLWG